LLQDVKKAMELWKQALALGSSKAHSCLAEAYRHELGDLKKAQFHYEAAAMAGHEVDRYNVGYLEGKYGCRDRADRDRAVKHWTIAASAGHYTATHFLREFFQRGAISRESIDSTLTAYNNSCAEMRSDARDAYIRFYHTLERL